MSITKLCIRDFRNIESAELGFSPGLNLITGANGAGKTSLLEAIYFLGRTQSFRTSHAASVIRAGAEALLVTGSAVDRHGATVPVGVQRDKTSVRVRLSGRSITQLSELLTHFPFQLLTPDSHQFFEGGPRFRRRFLDWGVFHVEPAFIGVWQRYSRALRQRNAALRAKSSAQEVTLWDSELVQAAQLLDQQRQAYKARLIAALTAYLENLSDVTGLEWLYRSGWPQKSDYATALAEGLDGDRRQGFTRIGPHRADLLPVIDGQPAHERISRGQQKQLVAALMLAQAHVYRESTGQACIFLIDDLASELDSVRRAFVLNHLHQLGSQVFLTAIDGADIDYKMWSARQQFHVEHGCVEEVIY